MTVMFSPHSSQRFNSHIHSLKTSGPQFYVPRSRRELYNYDARFQSMHKRKGESTGAQIVLFPTGEEVPTIEIAASTQPQGWTPHVQRRPRLASGWEVVLSGSFRRDIEGLRRAHEELLDLGCTVLSPARVDPVSETDGFVFMKGEETESPERLEIKHLEAIQKASFVWLHAPDGYVGLSAALEVGFAHAQGIPIFSRVPISDPTLAAFVEQVPSVTDALTVLGDHRLPPPKPNLASFQRYYKRVATQRGYERESAQNCLLLMVEELGELAREIRKREKLVRHGPSSKVGEAQELADVFLYVIHMANILGLDLGSAVREKEQINIAKFVKSRHASHEL
jgi:NTP pyrophosphatase (non-canonical NTP hydrolase)